MADLLPFRNLIRERCGLCFEDIRTASLLEGIGARMAKLEIPEESVYFKLLVSDDAEFHQLVNLLTINETYFFREPVHLQMLVKRLIPEFIGRKKPGEKVRIVSAGCSSGEEPYSVAMALMEKYGDGIQNFISLTGFDIDSKVIAGAQKGLFTSHSFRSFSARLQAKYFEREGNAYRISDTVKQKVEFIQHNLLSADYPPVLQGVDVIFYRNVSIYFEPEIRETIFRKLAGLLNEGGYLFVSATETLSHNIGVLSLVEIDDIFLYRKKVELSVEDRRKGTCSPPHPIPEEKALRPPKAAFRAVEKRAAVAPVMKRADAPVINRPVERRKDSSALYEEALSLAKSKHYEDALARIGAIEERDAAFTNALVLKAGILVNMKKLDEAEGACRQSIGIDQWCLEGYLLLGLIAKIKNDENEALKRFKEALYIQSSCWTAHFHLGDIYRSRGELERACREYEIVVKLLKKGDVTDRGLTFFHLSFPVEQVVHLCAHNLADIRKRLP